MTISGSHHNIQTGAQTDNRRINTLSRPDEYICIALQHLGERMGKAALWQGTFLR